MHSTNQVSFHQNNHGEPPAKKLKQYLASIGITYSYQNVAIDHTRLQPIVEKQPIPLKKQYIKQPIHHQQSQETVTKKPSPILQQINQCTTIDSLYTLLDHYHDCDLRKTATNTVFADGTLNAPVMIIGEAPGADEDAQGKPFVGKSGQLVDNMFNAIGLSRHENMYISNIVFWRPPGNRPPTPLEIDQCKPFIFKHIALAQPKILVLLGGVAAKAILDTKETIIQLRGKKHTFYHDDFPKGLPVLTFYHPAYLLRSPKQKGAFWHDLLHLKQILQTECILTQKPQTL